MGDRLATVDMTRKVGGGCCAPFHEGELRSEVAWAEACLHTNGIHPAVWTQYTNVTDRQDNCPVA